MKWSRARVYWLRMKGESQTYHGDLTDFVNSYRMIVDMLNGKVDTWLPVFFSDELFLMGYGNSGRSNSVPTTDFDSEPHFSTAVLTCLAPIWNAVDIKPEVNLSITLHKVITCPSRRFCRPWQPHANRARKSKGWIGKRKTCPSYQRRCTVRFTPFHAPTNLELMCFGLELLPHSTIQ